MTPFKLIPMPSLWTRKRISTEADKNTNDSEEHVQDLKEHSRFYREYISFPSIESEPSEWGVHLFDLTIKKITLYLYVFNKCTMPLSTLQV
jgi:hypothetical protein